MKPKNMSLLNAHTCTRKNVYVVITCNYSCRHKKIEKKNETNKESDSESFSNQPGLYFIFVPISYILFNSLLQLLLTDRNLQTFHPLSVLFLIPDVDQLFHYLMRNSLSLLCEQYAGLTKKCFNACWWHRNAEDNLCANFQPSNSTLLPCMEAELTFIQN